MEEVRWYMKTYYTHTTPRENEESIKEDGLHTNEDREGSIGIARLSEIVDRYRPKRFPEHTGAVFMRNETEEDIEDYGRWTGNDEKAQIFIDPEKIPDDCSCFTAQDEVISFEVKSARTEEEREEAANKYWSTAELCNPEDCGDQIGIKGEIVCGCDIPPEAIVEI